MDIETVAKVGAIFATGFSVGVGAAYHWASRGVLDSCRETIAELERSRKPRANPPTPEARPEPPPQPHAPPKAEAAPQAVIKYHLPMKIGGIATVDGCRICVLSTRLLYDRQRGGRYLTEYCMTGRLIDEETGMKGGN